MYTVKPLSTIIFRIRYLTAFGLAFTKTDHIMLIRLCWTSLVATETDYRIMKMLAHLLGRLLKYVLFSSLFNLLLINFPLSPLMLTFLLIY